MIQIYSLTLTKLLTLYGVVKDSGKTREGVAYAIKEMTEEKILVV